MEKTDFSAAAEPQAKKKKHNPFKKKLGGRAFEIVMFVLLAAYVLSILITLFWGFMTSLKGYGDFLEFPFGLPKKLVFENYLTAFAEIKVKIKAGAGVRTVYFEEMLLYSLLYSGVGGLIVTVVPMCTAYLVAKYPYKFSKVLYTVVIIVMIMPIVGSLPSEIQMAKALHFYDSFLGMMVMKCTFLGMYFLVFYATFKSLSWEYAESAFIDGAGHFTVMFRIMLPLVKTTMFCVFLLNFIAYWNDYMTPMIYLPSYPTAAYGLYYMKFALTSSFGTETMQLAACFVLALPLIILFLIFQKKLIGNLTVGGIKG